MSARPGFGTPDKSQVCGAPVDVALAAARTSMARLQRRQRLVAASSLALLAVVALRGATALVLETNEHRPLAYVLYVCTAIALGGVALGFRWGRRAGELRAEIASLELAREVVDHAAAPYVVVGPYRAPGSRAAEAQGRRDTASPWQLSEDRAGLGLGTLAAVAAACVLYGVVEESATATNLHFNFLENATPSALGFSTPVAAAGEWALEEHEQATGGRALVNRVGDEGAHPAVAVVDSFSARDVRAHTRCKFMPEHPEKACGLVFGYRDPAHYHVARLDDDGVTLAAVADGTENKLGHAGAEVSAGVWHDLGVVAKDKSIVVSWNGRELLRIKDASLPDQGTVGLWAPPRGHVWFDVLAIEAPASQAALEPLRTLPLVGGRS
ncbi:MAG: hypothetical protein HOV80_27590 [Polyangiaceae bacterium]|nr:hypothetical protein [Polyangiaceae bacterium]